MRPTRTLMLIEGFVDVQAPADQPAVGALKGDEMTVTRSSRLMSAAAVRAVGGFKAAIEDLRRGSNHKPLVAAIVASLAMVAALDFWTSAELIGSILFTVPLVLCALQPSEAALLDGGGAERVLTLAAGFLGC